MLLQVCPAAGQQIFVLIASKRRIANATAIKLKLYLATMIAISTPGAIIEVSCCLQPKTNTAFK